MNSDNSPENPSEKSGGSGDVRRWLFFAWFFVCGMIVLNYVLGLGFFLSILVSAGFWYWLVEFNKDEYLYFACCLGVVLFAVMGGGCTYLSGGGGSAGLTTSTFNCALLNNALALNKKQASFPCSYATLVKMIGKPNRTLDGLSITHVWDKWGLNAFQEDRSKIIGDVTFIFRTDSERGSFNPKVNASSVVVNGVTINRDSSRDDVVKAGGTKNERGSVDLSLGRMKVYFSFNRYGELEFISASNHAN